MQNRPTMREVSELLTFVVTSFGGCGRGVAILLGDVRAPSALEMYEAEHGTVIGSALGSSVQLGTRVECGERVAQGQRILENKREELIDRLGGWKRLSRIAKQYARLYPEPFGDFAEYARALVDSALNGDTRRKGNDLRTTRRRVSACADSIALYIITRPDEPTV